jgi:hypothetical protein
MFIQPSPGFLTSASTFYTIKDGFPWQIIHLLNLAGKQSISLFIAIINGKCKQNKGR